MKRWGFVSACFVLVYMLSNCFISASEAQTKRALLVGINQYLPESVDASEPDQESSLRRFGNLDGCINDVTGVYEIITKRFEFDPQNVLVLKDTMASRKRILDEFKHFLIDAASPGDEVFFYYAGHGSLVRNLTPSPTEHDSIDASLVPSDSYWGAPDIRSKELRRLSNEALNKNLVLTMIVDACHSGTISRGVPAPGKSRHADPDPIPVSDPSDPGPIPAERGALVISAAQAHESAWEAPEGDHGAFTAAFIEVLRQASVNTPATELFTRVRARMHAEANSQEPNFQGEQRRNKPLFGGSRMAAGHNVRVPVLKVDEMAKMVQLEGGTALGIYPNSELHRVGDLGDSSVRIRISEVQGLNKTTAKVIDGDMSSIRTSDLFEMDMWSLPDEALLRVWLPASCPFSKDSYAHTIGSLNALKAAMGSSWVEDPTEESPTHIVMWDGKEWGLKYGEKTVSIGKELNPDRVKSVLAGSANDVKVRLFAYLPPTEDLIIALREAVARSTGGVKIVVQRSQAHYLLAGRLNGLGLDYAWIMPNKIREDADSTTLPIRTDWMHLGGGTGGMKILVDSLEEMLLRLERIRGWLTLNGPSDQESFPYTLSLKDTLRGELKSGGVVFGGEKYTLVLRARKEDLINGVSPRYFYVFVLDSDGNSILLFPSDGNIGNRVPVMGQNSTYTPEVLELSRDTLNIQCPFGVDTYFLLTSAEAIDPYVLDSEGVRQRRETRGSESALGSLLQRIGTGTRGDPVPTNWSIRRMQILSKPPQ